MVGLQAVATKALIYWMVLFLAAALGLFWVGRPPMPV
jgi:hypothetical protein